MTIAVTPNKSNHGWEVCISSAKFLHIAGTCQLTPLDNSLCNV